MMLPVLLCWGALAADPATSWRARIDWDAAGVEASEVLAGYLRVDTRNPPGNEAAGVAYLAGFLEAEGIAWEEIAHAEGRSSLVARVPGTGLEPPLCLLSHVDVATFEEGAWARGPLSGDIDEDGAIWGRGALDMKGMGAIELMTLVWLARLEVPLRRDVVMLAVADEEVDNAGMRDLVANHWERIGCSHLINEGGLGLRDALFEGQAVHAISVAEKGLLWVRMIARGEAGHGSTVHPDEAPGRLLAAMEAVATYRARPRIDPAMYALLREVGRTRRGLTRFAMSHPWAVRLLVRPTLMGDPTTRATITDTVHLTGTGGAAEPNVVPSEVWAQYDCRLLPGTTPEAMLAELRHRTRAIPGIEFEVIHAALANGSPWDDPLYEAIARYAVEGRPGAVAGPVLSVGFTDSLLARPLGVRAYGYVPFEVSGDEAGTMHGRDERVSTEQVGAGLRALFSIVVSFAG